MIAALSTLSSYGLWILIDPHTGKKIAEKTWQDTDNSGHSSKLSQTLTDLCSEQDKKIQEIKGLMGACGPGAFTGLRMCASFLKGLSLSLHCPLYPIPTYSLFNKSVFLPLRHLKAIQMNREEYLQAGFECLKITAPVEAEVATPTPADTILFFGEHKIWPTPDELLRGALWALKNPQDFVVDYGLDVKISGVRTAL